MTTADYFKNFLKTCCLFAVLFIYWVKNNQTRDRAWPIGGCKGVGAILEKRKTTALVRAASMGDKQAFVSLVDMYRQSMYATAMAVTRSEDDALDAIQDTLLTMWEKLGTLKDPGAFKTWMTRILVNNCCGTLRGRKREMPVEQMEESGAPMDRDTSLDVRAALAALSENDRLLLQLFYFEDLSVKDIASVLSLTPEAVRMRLTRSRKRFREQYERPVNL